MKLLTRLSRIVLLVLIFPGCREKEKVLAPQVIVLSSTDGIVPLVDSLVRPVLYRQIPSLAGLPVKETKEKFIAIVLPAVLIARHHLATGQQRIRQLSKKKRWSAEDSAYYASQRQRFKAKNIFDLAMRMSTHPNSITLAQAAVESGWGSSRFFKEANNLFGIWAYTDKEPRIPANEGDVFLRKYDDIAQSIEDYFVTLGRARPYRAFRRAKADSATVDQLLPHLKHYSARGKAYTDQLKTIIDQNNMTQYDHYQIDPQYFIEK
ncbi:MAG: glucosaminidase domain-containing protein [Cytophagales bacterium]|nr:glucosaminidase domain-containing protein [Cytophagales bacterium]